MNLKSLAAGRSDLLQINPELIGVDPDYNVRKFDAANDPEDAALVESIRHNGIRTPLTVRLMGERVVVVAGHRRLAAVTLLNAAGSEIKTLPCMPEQRGTTVEDRDLDLITSNSGKPLTELQRAAVFVRLLRHGWSESEIAKRVGVTEQTVRNQIAIHELPTPIKHMVEAEEVSASLAVQVVRSEGEAAPAVLEEALEIAKAEGKDKATAKSVAKVETKGAAKKAAKIAVKESSALVPAPVPDSVIDLKADVLATLDAMVKSLERYESNPKVNPRSRQAIEKARLAVALAFDITDQN